MPQVVVDGVSLHYEQEGVGSDLLLIHGLGGSLQVWDADVPVFARHHRVTRFDVRGHGESDKPPGPYSITRFAHDVVAICDAAGIESTHVLGISMGGVIAQRVAFDAPRRLRSLILMSTSSEVGPRAVTAWQRLADRVERFGFDAQTADASRAFAPAFAKQHPDVVAALARRNAANDPHGYAAAVRAVSDYNWTADLHRVRVPVLILQGLDDQLTPPGGSVKMSRVLPCARLVMVDDAGHNLAIEQPAVFQSSVLAFAAGVDFATAAR